MRHHKARREVLADRETAQHGLRDDAERQQAGEDREVAPERPARERKHGNDSRDHADKPGQRPVAELDQRVALERRIDAAVAPRPGRAAEARVVSRTAAPVNTIKVSAARAR